MDSSEFYEKLLAHYESEVKRNKSNNIIQCIMYAIIIFFLFVCLVFWFIL